MSELTVGDLHNAANTSITEEIESIRIPGLLTHSSDLTDLLIWNVVIAFVVGISSNAAFVYLSKILRKTGRIDQRDLHIHIHAITDIRVTISEQGTEEANILIRSVLRNFLRSDDDPATAIRITRHLEAIVRAMDEIGISNKND